MPASFAAHHGVGGGLKANAAGLRGVWEGIAKTPTSALPANPRHAAAIRSGGRSAQRTESLPVALAEQGHDLDAADNGGASLAPSGASAICLALGQADALCYAVEQSALKFWCIRTSASEPLPLARHRGSTITSIDCMHMTQYSVYRSRRGVAGAEAQHPGARG
jgi:hypothetical protein